MYKLIINGILADKVLYSLDELLQELANLNQETVYSLNWVEV